MSAKAASADARSSGLHEAALHRLYVDKEKALYNVVYRWVWNAEEAQDVVQEAFVKLWAARSRIDPSTVEPYLYRTALNLASNRRRRNKLWRWLGLEALDESPSGAQSAEHTLAAEQRRLRVREAVERLPEKQRRVVLLAEFSGLSYGDIALTLGVPEGTVASRRNSALQKLRQLLAGEDDD